MYIRRSWHLEGIIERLKRHGDGHFVSSFCTQVFAKVSKSSSHRIRISKMTCTYDFLLNCILRPKTSIGLIILMRCCDHQQISQLRTDMNMRYQCINYLEKIVNYFPSYLIDNRNLWYEWCEITAPIVSSLTNKFSNHIGPKPRLKPYDKRLNLRHFKSK